MTKHLSLSLAIALFLGGCEGFTFGNAVVGPVPETEGGGGGDRVCGEVRTCAAYRPAPPAVWTPQSDPTVGAECGTRTTYTLRGDEALHPMAELSQRLTAPQVGEGPPELRCLDIEIEVPGATSSFELDLRNITLMGTRIRIASESRGRVLVGTTGTFSASEFEIHGPVDIIAERAVVWAARVSLLPSEGHAPAGLLFGLLSQFNQLEVLGEGTVALRRSLLEAAHIEAEVLRTELSPWRVAFVRADSVEIFDADLWQAHVESGHFIAAAGVISFSEFAACDEIILAAVTVNRTRLGPTSVPILLSAAMLMNSYVEADLSGDGRIVQSGLLGQRIDLDGGAIANSALCGVDFLGLTTGDVACIRCDEGAPADICAFAHREPLCPGYETAACSTGPRAGVPRGV